MNLKDLARATLNYLHLDLTKNLAYDRLTKQIMKRVIKPGSTCIDIGCHKGEMLDVMLSLAPNGRHIGFEPIPVFYEQLRKKYEGRATIYPYALSDVNGQSTFQFVKNAPAYSGIKKRQYAVEKPDIEEIRVELKTLDELLDPSMKIDFMKIDVEGGEFGVLKGSKNLLKKWKPVVIFESGLGASEFYGTKPADLYSFITGDPGLKVSTLKSYAANRPPLSADKYIQAFSTNSEYYFIAHP